MPQARDIERRLNDLEIKASFTEDLVDRLNEAVARQQAQIELLARELVALRRSGVVADEPASPHDELPPHY